MTNVIRMGWAAKKKYNLYFWFKYDLGQKYHAPQVLPDRGSNLRLPDHDSTFHVTETPARTTRPSVTSFFMPVKNGFEEWLEALMYVLVHTDMNMA